MFDHSDNELILYMAGCTLARVPGNQNWLEEKAVGGLPEYICRIARAIHEGDAAKSISQVIAIAVSRVKVWSRGGGGVTAKTRVKAAKALAQWEAKKKAAKLDNKVKTTNTESLFLQLSSSYNVDEVRKQYTLQFKGDAGSPYSYRYIREMWSDFMIVAIESEGAPSMKFVKVNYSVDKDGNISFGEEKEVKQSYVELSHPDLQTSLTDAQLERAGLIPCTEKVNRSLLENIALSKKLQQEQKDLLRFSADKPHLANLLRN